jgi:hypothetical protein
MIMGTLHIIGTITYNPESMVHLCAWTRQLARQLETHIKLGEGWIVTYSHKWWWGVCVLRYTMF